MARLLAVELQDASLFRALLRAAASMAASTACGCAASSTAFAIV